MARGTLATVPRRRLPDSPPGALQSHGLGEAQLTRAVKMWGSKELCGFGMRKVMMGMMQKENRKSLGSRLGRLDTEKQLGWA